MASRSQPTHDAVVLVDHDGVESLALEAGKVDMGDTCKLSAMTATRPTSRLTRRAHVWPQEARPQHAKEVNERRGESRGHGGERRQFAMLSQVWAVLRHRRVEGWWVVVAE